MPPTAIIPNIRTPAPPSTGLGMIATRAPILGKTPVIIRMTPARATTNRLATPVRGMMPMFWLKDVLGPHWKIPGTRPHKDGDATISIDNAHLPK